MTVSAIIAGAGSGTRLGANMPKALVKLAGAELIVHAVRSMKNAGVDDVIVTVPAESRREFAQALDRAGLEARLVDGGLTRQDSVSRGLADVTTQFVLVHDAARALTPVDMIERVVAALLAGHRAVVPALPVTDTIKRVRAKDAFDRIAAGDARAAGASRADGSAGDARAEGSARADGSAGVADHRPEYVKKTVRRERLRAVQTPQGFDVDLLRQAHEAGKEMSAEEALAAPDDAALVEKLGVAVAIVPGSQEAMKITTPFDLAVAELIAARGDAHNRTR